MKIFPQHGFNISQVHPHWILPTKRQAALFQPWRNLPRSNAVEHVLPANAPQPSKKIRTGAEFDVHDEDATTPLPSFNPIYTARIESRQSIDMFRTPPQSNRISEKRQNYERIMNQTKDLIKMAEDRPELMQHLSESLGCHRAELQRWRAWASSHEAHQIAAGSRVMGNDIPLPHDPAMVTTPGRKRNSRIKSSTELRTPSRKQAKRNPREKVLMKVLPQ
jgi:hypothetical protein